MSSTSLESITRLRRCLSINAFGLFFLFLCSAPLIAQQKYSVKDIGNLGGDVWPYATISNNGFVAGASRNASGFHHAFIWDKVRGMVEIPTPCNGPNTASFALSVNSKGQVVGTCSRGIGQVGQSVDFVSFVSDPINGVSALGQPVGTCGSYLRGINENGAAAGDIYYDCQLVRGHGLRWDSAIHELISLGGPFPQTGSYSNGMAINSDGVVAGSSTLPDAIHQRAVIWGPNGIQNLGTLSGDSVAFSINDSQQVAGYFATEFNGHAFIWDDANGMRDLGTLPGGFYTSADDINNSGQVVGYGDSPSDTENYHAFAWDSRNEMRDLNDLIPPDSGWQLVEASSINDGGQIVGSGFHGGRQAIFLLTPLSEPLIFIPGVSGSYLVDKTTNSERWPGFLTFHDSLTLDPNAGPNPNIVATDAIRHYTAQIFGTSVYEQDYYEPLLHMLTTRGGYLEYQVNNNPARRTTDGCDLSQKSVDPALNPNLFVFAYDWRKSNIENAAALRDYVGCVQQFYPNEKVDILAHSMGGILARRFILDNPGKVRKLISIATPWVGAPKSLLAAETGDIGTSALLVSNSTIKTLAEFFPSIHQILPTRSYYDLGGLPFAEKGDFNGNGIPDELYTYAQQNDLLNQRHPRSVPGTTNVIFHDYPGQDDWRTDSSGVEYHHIFGEQHLNQTIGQVIAQRLNVCVSNGFGFDCDDREFFDTKMIGGDRTVPKRSASRIGTVVDSAGVPQSLNLNSPSAKFWYFFSLTDANDGFVEHTGLTQFTAVHNLVLFLLDKGPDPDIPPISRRSPLRENQAVPLIRYDNATTPKQKVDVLSIGPRATSSSNRASRIAHHVNVSAPKIKPIGFAATVQSDVQQPSPKSPVYYVKVMGVDFVSVTDELGNTNAPIDDTFARPVPNVTYNLIGDKAVLISTPTDKTYTITFRVGSNPISLEVLKGIDNVNPTEAIRYRDIVLPAGATAMLSLTPQGIQALRYDADGDGSFEGTVIPTASLIGSAAADATPPTLTFNSTPQQSTVLIAISAQDSESGVKATYYSLDRIHYQRYTAPFSVNPSQTPAVYAFADDNGANRSPMISYPVPPLLTGSPLSAVGPAQVWIGLKNSDDVGTKFDLLAVALKNGTVVGSGQLNDVPGGSSGFNNARLQAISLALVGSSSFASGDTLSIRLSVRIAASSGHRSGTARLWFNDTAANSRFSATIGGATNTYFLRSSSVLGTMAGVGPKNTVDVLVDRAVGGNPFKPFGTWSISF